ncbi:MAG: hypothetical protein ABSH22_00690 [Tepidisphaeraceae bacterium]
MDMRRFFKGLLLLAAFLGGSVPILAKAADRMSQETAAPIYAAELGSLYQPADLPKLYAAHLLIEDYFSAYTESLRKPIVAQLQATGIDPNILGRLARIRLSWPELAAGVYYFNEQVGTHEVKYFLGVPSGYKRSVSWPLVVKLPALNAFLTDPAPDADQVVHIYTSWITDELTAHPDALVLMPLLNLRELYGPSLVGMNTVFQPILDAADHANVDPARVYLMGHSMAAHAVWNLGLHYAMYLAAICPLAGGADADWQRLRLMNLRNTLPVVWADSDDQVIPVRQSRDIVEALRKLKIDVDYTETNNIGHLPPPDVVEQAYQKMRARVRQLYPAHISLQSDRMETLFNRMDWFQLYQELETGPNHTVRIQIGTGAIHLQNPFGMDATLNQNTVTMTTVNADSMRLYFNSQMVDFSKPVTVIVNGRKRFSGMLTQSIDEMLKDQLFLGRGWRYYTAVVDLDLSADTSPAPPRVTPQPTANGATSRPHGKITVYNDDGTVNRVIESP